MRELRRRSLEVYENKVDSSFGQRQLGMPFSPIPSLTTSNAAKNTIFCTNEVSVPSPALKAESDNVSARQAFDEKPWVAHTSRRSLAGCMRSSERGADMPKYGTSAPPVPLLDQYARLCRPVVRKGCAFPCLRLPNVGFSARLRLAG